MANIPPCAHFGAAHVMREKNVYNLPEKLSVWGKIKGGDTNFENSGHDKFFKLLQAPSLR